MRKFNFRFKESKIFCDTIEAQIIDYWSETHRVVAF